MNTDICRAGRVTARSNKEVYKSQQVNHGQVFVCVTKKTFQRTFQRR